MLISFLHLDAKVFKKKKKCRDEIKPISVFKRVTTPGQALFVPGAEKLVSGTPLILTAAPLNNSATPRPSFLDEMWSLF